MAGLNIYINIWMQNSLWQVCAWAHSSWRSLTSRTPLQNLLFCHRQTESWSQKRTQHQGWSCTFWRVSPWFQSSALLPCRGAEHRPPAEKTDVMRMWRLVLAGTLAFTEDTYHLLPLKQAIGHELAGPDCHCVILKMWSEGVTGLLPDSEPLVLRKLLQANNAMGRTLNRNSDTLRR